MLKYGHVYVSEMQRSVAALARTLTPDTLNAARVRFQRILESNGIVPATTKPAMRRRAKSNICG